MSHADLDAHKFAVAFTFVVTEESNMYNHGIIAKNVDESFFGLLSEVFPNVRPDINMAEMVAEWMP